jgi:broad specificity phosphatase PhoE
MGSDLPIVALARHGETAWSATGQHTGLTDLPLTERGEQNARQLGERLRSMSFDRVLTSPLRRAHDTCRLTGYGDRAEIAPELVEWDYGEYEGLRTAEIHERRPDWDLFRDGGPGGESPDDVAARADTIIKKVQAATGNVLIFSSGHFLRVFAARWIDASPAIGRHLALSTASLSIVGYDHNKSEPVIRLWNDTSHLNI